MHVFLCSCRACVLMYVHMVTDLGFRPTGIVAMQMEALEAVHRESRRLPPIQKVSVAEVQKTQHLKCRPLYYCFILKALVSDK